MAGSRYCQSLNDVAAHLLIVLEDEETAFWVLAQLVQVIVPEYYSESLGGLSADAAVLSQLSERFVPVANQRFEDAGACNDDGVIIVQRRCMTKRFI